MSNNKGSGTYRGFSYKWKEVDVDWSEDAIEYEIRDTNNKLLNKDQCEFHMRETYIFGDINKAIDYKNQ